MAEDEEKVGKAQSRAQALGPTGERVAANLARLRTARGMSTGRLSEKLAELGRPIPPSGITKIEKHVRRVDTDDLVALALALNVSPLALLLPATGAPRDICALTDVVDLSAADAWRWADGSLPHAVSDADPEGDVQRFRLDSRPPFARPKWSDLATFVRDRNARGRAMLDELGPPWSGTEGGNASD